MRKQQLTGSGNEQLMLLVCKSPERVWCCGPLPVAPLPASAGRLSSVTAAFTPGCRGMLLTELVTLVVRP